MSLELIVKIITKQKMCLLSTPNLAQIFGCFLQIWKFHLQLSGYRQVKKLTPSLEFRHR